MMAQGALVMLLGLIWLMGGSLAGVGIATGPDVDLEPLAAVLSVFGCGAFVMLTAGAMGIAAGWFARSARHRTFVFVGLFAAAFSGFNILCWFLGIAVMIYGMIILLDPDTKRRFDEATLN